MNFNSRIYKVLICFAGVCAAAAAVFLYFAQTVGYDLSIQHFAKESPYALGAVLSGAAAAILGISAAAVRAHDPARAHFAPPSAFFIFASSITAFMMLASFILSIRALASGLPILELVRLIFVALSAAFFFLVTTQEQKGDGFALLSLCPMLYALLSVLVIYFDTGYGMNAPIKAYYLLLYLSMALFFSAEARTVIRGTQPFTYTFFGVLCFTASAAVGLSQLAIALYDTVGHGFSVIDSALWIGIALFALSRLISFDAADTAEVSKNAEKITETEEETHGAEKAGENAD